MNKYLPLQLLSFFFLIQSANGQSTEKILPCKSITTSNVVAVDGADLLSMVRSSHAAYSIRCGIIDDDGFVSMKLLTFLIEKKAVNTVFDLEKKLSQAVDTDEKRAIFKSAFELKSDAAYKKFMESEVQDWAPIKSALLKNLNKLIAWLDSPKRKSGHDAQERQQEMTEAKYLKKDIQEMNSPVTIRQIKRISDFLKFYQYKHGYTTVCKDPNDDDNYLGRRAVLTPVAIGSEENKPVWSQSNQVTGFEDRLDNGCVDGIRGDPVVVARSMISPSHSANKNSPLSEKNGAK